MITAGFKTRRKRRYKKPRATVRQQHNWSNYQQALFADIASGEGNTVVNAVPGSGKSASIIEGVFHLPTELQQNRRTLVTAYNKSIATHLEGRVLPGIAVETNHRLGFRTTLKHWGSVYGLGGYGSVDKDNDSIYNLTMDLVGDSMERNDLRQQLVKAVIFCKTRLSDSDEEIENTCLQYGISFCGRHTEEFISLVKEIMERTRIAPLIYNNRSVITFSDMIWLPYANGWLPEQFDRVFIDEAQDISPDRAHLLLSAVKQGGRVWAVGDSMQAINGYCGAGVGSLERLSRELCAKHIPLSISYRCPKAVIELAKKINPQIEAREDVPDGTVDYIESDGFYESVEPGSVVLSRTNFPLIRACFGFLARGYNANIQGKDIGDRYLWRINCCWQPTTTKELIERVNEWRDDLCARLAEKRYSTTSVEDEAQSIKAFAHRSDSIAEVKECIKQFFSDEDAQIKLSTAHRFKGLEKDKVYLLSKTFHPERGGEEENVFYVSITRSRNHLVFVDGSLGPL